MTERKTGPARAEELSSTIGQRLAWSDVAEIVIGSSVLAFPVSVTEEVWTLSEVLPLGRVLHLSIWSVIFIGAFTYHRYFRGQLRDNVGRFVLRVGAVYVVTLASVASLLLALDKLTTVETVVAVKRVVIVAFPASFAATIVDGMSRDEASIKPEIQDPRDPQSLGGDHASK